MHSLSSPLRNFTRPTRLGLSHSDAMMRSLMLINPILDSVDKFLAGSYGVAY